MCYAVPIARTGSMEYYPAELQDQTIGQINGRVRIINTPDVLFSEQTMAGFEGKPVTVQHPAPNANPTIPDVTPENWKDVAVGIAQNVRQGDGDDIDKLVADLLITDADAIALVKNGLRQISCGYDADLYKIAEGEVMRVSIIGNHVALVDAGRAGADVAIRDKKPDEGKSMTSKFTEWLTSFKKLADEMPVEKEPTDEPVSEPAQDADPMQMIAGLAARLGALESMLADMKPKDAAVEIEMENDPEPEPEPMMDKCQDADVISKAEILAPGIENTADIKVQALAAAMKTSDGKAAIDAALHGVELDLESAAVVDIAFNGAANVLTEQRKAALAKTRTVDSAPVNGGNPVSADELNKLHAQFWANR